VKYLDVVNQGDGNQPDLEERWRQLLTDGRERLVSNRPFFKRLPSPPRCKLCAAPFAGVGGFFLRPAGFVPWEKNPSLCRRCITTLEERGAGGAEVECSLLFADVRGSTGLAERIGSAAFSTLLGRFYGVASAAIVDTDGIVDKFVGDEVVGLYVPVFAGTRHAAAALRAAERILEGTGHGRDEGPWVPIGIGVHAGPAFVGTVGGVGEVRDFTALGDTVNSAARLASEAAEGEALVSEDSLASAGLGAGDLEQRVLTLRGRSAPLAVRVARIGSFPSSPVA
jgi:adenylate cyclase